MKNPAEELGTASVSTLIFRLVPPMMLVFFVQAMYNITDSLFIARYNQNGLTALSIILPLQLILLAAASGSGSGVNVIAAKFLGEGKRDDAEKTAFHGLVLSIFNWIILSVICMIFLTPFFKISTSDEKIIELGINYGTIILTFSFGLHIESCCTKILQASGNMKIPMIAQTAGAAFNILFDYILIFGKFGFPEMGVSGAAISTVSGQILAMIIAIWGIFENPSVKIKLFKPDIRLIVKIYCCALPNIIMQALYTFYIFGLNMILETFSLAAVTALGIYYKLQSFFFIPLLGMEQAILPLISYNYGLGEFKRIRSTLKFSCFISVAFMTAAAVAFIIIPELLVSVFSSNSEILTIGKQAFPIIGASFIPAGVTLLMPVFFQAIGKNIESISVTILRQILLFVPLAWIFAQFGLSYVWLTFPLTETITLIYSLILLRKSNVFQKNIN